jgi:hypothetical protein
MRVTRALGRRLGRVLPFLAGALAGAAAVRVVWGARRSRLSADPYGEAAGRGHPESPPSAAALAAGYETTDVSARDIARIMAVFAVGGFASVGLMLWGLGHLHQADMARAAGLTGVERTPITVPEPHLQADPQTELGALQVRQAALLHHYARLPAGLARIPIDRAMVLLVGTPMDPPGTVFASAAASGRSRP